MIKSALYYILIGTCSKCYLLSWNLIYTIIVKVSWSKLNWILQLINDFIRLQPKIGHVILIPIVSTDYQVSQKIGPWSSHNVFFCVHSTVLKVWQKMWRVHYLPYLHTRMLFSRDSVSAVVKWIAKFSQFVYGINHGKNLWFTSQQLKPYLWKKALYII